MSSLSLTSPNMPPRLTGKHINIVINAGEKTHQDVMECTSSCIYYTAA